MIVAVGHTWWQMERLVSMLPDLPTVLVFNGDKPFPNALHVPNSPQGRDAAMYKAGLDASGFERAVFVNDAVEYIHSEFWNQEGDLVGQANLSSWVDYSKCDEHALAWHKSRGREVRFIRTSCFIATAERFNQIYKASGGVAQKFEKATLKDSKSHTIVPPEWIIDNNLVPYL